MKQLILIFVIIFTLLNLFLFSSLSFSVGGSGVTGNCPSNCSGSCTCEGNNCSTTRGSCGSDVNCRCTDTNCNNTTACPYAVLN
jgi:hypothetical protein